MSKSVQRKTKSEIDARDKALVKDAKESSLISVSNLAKKYGIATSTVYRILNYNGIYHPNIQGDMLKRNKQIWEKYKAGVPVACLSKEYDISTKRIYMILSENPEYRGDSKLSQRERLREKKKDRNRKILADIEAHPTASVAELAEKYGISIWRVYGIIHESKVDFRDKRVISRNNKMFSDYMHGLSPMEISEKYGVSLSRIYILLDGFCKTDVFQEFSNSQNSRAIVSRYVGGMTTRALAEEYKLSQHCVNKLLKKAGVYKKAGDKTVA